MSLIVKLGGSFLASPLLRPLLAALGETGAGVVAGGGPFADAVRTTQARLGFDDRTAHLMALMAMNQTALAFAALAPALAPVPPAVLRRRLAAGEGALLLPWPDWAEEPGLPASWEATSDSIALLLAQHAGLPLLVLKRALPPDLHPQPAAWAARGIIDPLFPRLAVSFPHPLALRDEAWAAAWLATPARPPLARAAFAPPAGVRR